MCSYLVTGGCGFIGSHLVDKLVQMGHKVLVLDNLSTGFLANLNPKATFIEGDICDAALVKKIMQQCDGCFHLAAIASVQESVDHWVETNHTNLVGTITLLDAAKSINAQRPFNFVYASSAAVYGAHANPPFKETDTLNPISPYGVDKESCELQAKIAGSLYHLPNVGLRFFNVYGERQSPDSMYTGVISIFLERIKQGKNLQIFGDGLQVRDFIYVEEVVAYLCAAMEKADVDSLIFNVCSSTGTTILELAEILLEQTDVNLEITHVAAKAGDIRISIGDNTLAKAKLHLPESIPLTIGLTNLCDSYGLKVAAPSTLRP